MKNLQALSGTRFVGLDTTSSKIYSQPPMCSQQEEKTNITYVKCILGMTWGFSKGSPITSQTYGLSSWKAP